MSVYIHDIATTVPETHANQQEIRELMKSNLSEDRKTQAILHRIYAQSGIEKRHTVMEDFFSNDPDSFFKRAMSEDKAPSTAERNRKYQKDSVPLFLKTGLKLLDNKPDLKPEQITHVITVSCTGFFAPGPDFEVVRGLGLLPSTERYHIGFMGCYAAFPALKMAQSFCAADPDATVLVIAAELCSLHFQYQNDIDNLIASSVFADGAAGAIVSSQKPEGTALSLDRFASSLAYEGEKDMAWTIGDKGFNMVLSSYVPDIIASRLEEVISPLFEQMNITKDAVQRWAVHPGGRAIIDKVQESMGLTECQVRSSRKILSEFGNMSSATVLFVLEDLMHSELSSGDHILPIAFGPGLTIETGLFTYLKP